METILNYIAMWIPSITAIAGIITVVLTALKKVTDTINQFKADNTVNDLKAEMERIVQQNIKIATQNRELVYQNDILIDEMKKIKKYRENQGKWAK